MLRRNWLAVWLVVLLASPIIAQQRRSCIPSITKHLNHGNRDLVLSYSVNVDGSVSIAHAMCRRRNDREQHTEDGGDTSLYKQCLLSLETTTAASGKRSSTRTCDLRLRAKWGGTLARQYQLVRVGYERLLLVWRENLSPEARRRRYIPYPLSLHYRLDHLRLELVNMTSCESSSYPLVSEQRERIYEPKICANAEECARPTEIFAEDERRMHNVNVVVSDDDSGFDVFFRNRALCGRERRCKLSYDSHSRKFSSDAVASLEVNYDASLEVYPLVSERGDAGPILGYAVRSLRLDDGAVTLLSREGRAIYEHTYSWSPLNLAKAISGLAMSTAAEALGICQQPASAVEPRIQCSLFDSKARALLGVDVALGSAADVAVMHMRNSYDGGFLLLVGYANASTDNGLDALHIVRVDSRGELAAVHSAKSHRCWRDETGVEVGLLEMSATRLCYYMVCTWPMPKFNADQTHWQLFGDCFDEAKDRTPSQH